MFSILHTQSLVFNSVYELKNRSGSHLEGYLQTNVQNLNLLSINDQTMSSLSEFEHACTQTIVMFPNGTQKNKQQ